MARRRPLRHGRQPGTLAEESNELAAKLIVPPRPSDPAAVSGCTPIESRAADALQDMIRLFVEVMLLDCDDAVAQAFDLFTSLQVAGPLPQIGPVMVAVVLDDQLQLRMPRRRLRTWPSGTVRCT